MMKLPILNVIWQQWNLLLKNIVRNFFYRSLIFLIKIPLICFLIRRNWFDIYTAIALTGMMLMIEVIFITFKCLWYFKISFMIFLRFLIDADVLSVFPLVMRYSIIFVCKDSLIFDYWKRYMERIINLPLDKNYEYAHPFREEGLDDPMIITILLVEKWFYGFLHWYIKKSLALLSLFHIYSKWAVK